MPQGSQLGMAWSAVLPSSHRAALTGVFRSLCDGFFEDISSEDSVVFADSELGSLLPPAYRHRYTLEFGRWFFLSFATVGWKLAQPDQVLASPSCVAEELALRILVTEAAQLLERAGEEPGFAEFEDAVLQDTDVEWLYDPTHDGIEDTEVAEQLGMGHLHFDEWFEPFANAQAAVHPYGLG